MKTYSLFVCFLKSHALAAWKIHLRETGANTKFVQKSTRAWTSGRWEGKVVSVFIKDLDENEGFISVAKTERKLEFGPKTSKAQNNGL